MLQPAATIEYYPFEKSACEVDWIPHLILDLLLLRLIHRSSTTNTALEFQN